ncbi:uncharacterized protein LOC133526654 [Cydia pomonella]|uniref:uncharacterized protein LOC133526654 n=1 Tax=Cydia pomonella TaxID=82600 RepID=UPI002ADE8D1B|nr:uncharacterized protein LOC133526654 [Cydia pomonella]
MRGHLFFYGPRRAPPRGAEIIVGGVPIAVKPTLLYLGVLLDSKWNFEAHFKRLAPKLLRAAAAFGRILPNLGGPMASCRRLYMGVVRSMALYGAPVWADSLSSYNIGPIATTAEGNGAESNQRVPHGERGGRVRAGRFSALGPGCENPRGAVPVARGGAGPGRPESTSGGGKQRTELLEEATEMWVQRLERPSAGSRTIEAVRPVLRDWVERRSGVLTFRLTQVLSGHGCFGSYLHKVAQREPTPECHQCGADVDSAQHTLAECPVWGEEREELVAQLGQDLSLPAVVRAMLGSERAWETVLTFCEHVIRDKEAAEREREALAEANPMRRRRTGRRRAAHERNLPP